MKKSRILSALTSVAMVGTMIASALPFTASAFDRLVVKESVSQFSLVPEKSSFTMDEVKAGNAKTTVAMLVDNFGDDELVTYLKSGFAASDSGITLSNLKFTEVNGLTNVNGTGGKFNRDFDASGISGTNFFIQNGPDKWFVKNDNDASVVTFDVTFDSSMAEGEYTIDFDNQFELLSGNSTAAGLDKDDPNYGLVNVDYSASVTKIPATITLGSSSPSTEGTTEPSEATTESEDNRVYVGDANLWADKVEAAPGEEVVVNMYIDTQGKEIRGLEARAMFDRTMLEVTKMVQDWGLDKSATITLEEALYVVSSAV